MKVILLSNVHDLGPYLYRNLRGRFEVEHCVLPGTPKTDRKWKRILLILATQALHVPAVLRLIIGARGQVLLVCYDSHIAGLISGLISRLFCMKPRIYLCNFYIRELGKVWFVRRMLQLLLSQGVGLLAQSPTEAAWFRGISPKSQVDYYPYCQGDIEKMQSDVTALGDYIFSGGGSNRDYDLLIDVARNLPSLKFIIVRFPDNILPHSIPQNVKVCTDIPYSQFLSLMAGSRLVIIPLKHDVGSSGQQVSLTAMEMGKTIIYADFSIVSQYFRDGYSGIAYQPRNAADLASKIDQLTQDQDRLIVIGKHAHSEWAARFTRDKFEAELIGSIERFVARR